MWARVSFSDANQTIVFGTARRVNVYTCQIYVYTSMYMHVYVYVIPVCFVVRIVEQLGAAKAIKILKATEDIEESGGLMVMVNILCSQ